MTAVKRRESDPHGDEQSKQRRVSGVAVHTGDICREGFVEKHKCGRQEDTVPFGQHSNQGTSPGEQEGDRGDDERSDSQHANTTAQTSQGAHWPAAAGVFNQLQRHGGVR